MLRIDESFGVMLRIDELESFGVMLRKMNLNLSA